VILNDRALHPVHRPESLLGRDRQDERVRIAPRPAPIAHSGLADSQPGFLFTGAMSFTDPLISSDNSQAGGCTFARVSA
jgi:hypothetical protein